MLGHPQQLQRAPALITVVTVKSIYKRSACMASLIALQNKVHARNIDPYLAQLHDPPNCPSTAFVDSQAGGPGARVHLEVVLDDRGERLGAGRADGVVPELQRGQVLVAAQRFRYGGDALRANVVAADVQRLQAGVAAQRRRNLQDKQRVSGFAKALRADVAAADVQRMQAGVAAQSGRDLRDIR